MSSYLSVLKNYATFSGRARRKEFWMFTLINILIIVALNVLATVTESKALMYVYFIYALATFIPAIAVAVRRLHDTGKSGGWYFVLFIPLIGGIWLIVLTATEGQRQANAYGPDPKAVTA